MRAVRLGGLSAQLLAIPGGAQGTRETLHLMARIVRDYKKALPVRTLALNIVRSVGGHKNYSGMVKAIHSWVQNNIQYVPDIRDVETLQTPDKTLEFHQGDCDDQSMLIASLLEAVGFKTRFVAIKVSPLGPFVHVFTEVNLGTVWFPVETTEPWEAGRGPKRVAARMVENV